MYNLIIQAWDEQTKAEKTKEEKKRGKTRKCNLQKDYVHFTKWSTKKLIIISLEL